MPWNGVPDADRMGTGMETVFITGADRGVGSALTAEFAAHGYRVLAGQFMPEWMELEELEKKYPGRITRIPLDVGNTQSVRQAAAEAAQLTDRVDILVNCAGVYLDNEKERFARTLNINTFGPLRVTGEFLPLMEKGRKRICYFSSEAGSMTLLHRTGETDSAYCISKAMLNMQAKLLFNELRPKGFTFRLYHPGWVRSYMSGVKATEGRYEPEETAGEAFRQFTQAREWEDVLLMTDVKGEIWTF